MIDFALDGVIILAVSMVLLLWNIKTAPIISDDEEDVVEDIARQEQARRTTQRRQKSLLTWLYDKNKAPAPDKK
jgi:hypothetical protein